jgi:hypothetical protein
MYTYEMFWQYIERVNVTLFPAQFIIQLIALVLLYLVIKKPGVNTDISVKCFLCGLYVLFGVINILLVTEPLMKTQYTRGAIVSFLIAFLWGIDLYFKRTHFSLKGRGIYIHLVMLGYVFILYPLVGALGGQSYPRMPLFGVFPCPSHMYSLVLLSASLPYVDRKVFILTILFAMSAGIYGPVKNQIYGNIGTGVVALYSLCMLIRNWKRIPGKMESKHE